MAARVDESYNWLLKHFSELPNSNIKCKHCDKTYTSIYHEKSRCISHLYLQHEIYNEEEKLRWKNNDNMIWRYFKKTDLYIIRCIFCKVLYFFEHNSLLEKHLKRKHSQEVAAMIQTDIANNSLSEYFTISVKHFTVECNHCRYSIDVLSNQIIKYLKIHYNHHVNSGN